MIRSVLKASAVALALLPGLASASTDATVFAGFDPTLQDAFFTITNDSSSTETGLILTTSFGPTTSVNLDAQFGHGLAAGQSETYYFNAVNGGFLVGAGENNLSDSTTYQLSLNLGGQTLSSNIFSPATNSTGGYVDFLGNTCAGYGPCVDANNNPVVLTGTVAAVSAVPLPPAWTLMISALFGGFLMFRRSASHLI